MTKIAIILGSTRPGRTGEQVARWAYDLAVQRSDAAFELVDLLDYKLPHLDEPMPPSFGQYANEHTRAWAAKVAEFDGYAFVAAEYNHGIPGALKTALDFVYAEWNNKAAGFISYGSGGGIRAVEQLRLVAAELQMATVRTQVSFFFTTDFENYTTLKPGPHHQNQLAAMLDQLVSWSNALASLRQLPVIPSLRSATTTWVRTHQIDADDSRSISWQRRPYATALLIELRNLTGGDAVAIGEPHRASYGNRYALKFPLAAGRHRGQLPALATRMRSCCSGMIPSAGSWTGQALAAAADGGLEFTSPGHWAAPRCRTHGGHA